MSTTTAVNHLVYKPGATQVGLPAGLKPPSKTENKTNLSGLVFFRGEEGS